MQWTDVVVCSPALWDWQASFWRVKAWSDCNSVVLYPAEVNQFKVGDRLGAEKEESLLFPLPCIGLICEGKMLFV